MVQYSSNISGALGLIVSQMAADSSVSIKVAARTSAAMNLLMCKAPMQHVPANVPEGQPAGLIDGADGQIGIDGWEWTTAENRIWSPWATRPTLTLTSSATDDIAARQLVVFTPDNQSASWLFH